MKYLLLLLFIFPLTATASECRGRCDDGDTVNNTTVINNNKTNDRKIVIDLIVAICVAPQVSYNYIWPATVGLFTMSKPKFQSWNGVCWPEDAEAEPIPAPSNDVTPNNVKNQGSIYLFKGR